MAVCVLRGGVEGEALASLDALGASPELGPFVSRLRALIFGELDLFQYVKPSSALHSHLPQFSRLVL